MKPGEELLAIFLIFSLYHVGISQSSCNRRLIIPQVILTTQKDQIGKEVWDYAVPRDVQTFVLNCSFHQPIDWKFDGILANTVTTVKTGQTYDKFWDWTNPCYYVALIFKEVREEITGNYKCFHRAIERESTTVTVFGGQDQRNIPILILRGKTVNVNAKRGQTNFNFPCAISSRGGQETAVAVVLLSEENPRSEAWEPVPQNLFTYNPSTGFEFFVSKIDVPRKYKCEIIADKSGTGTAEDESVLINLIPAPEFVVNPSNIKSQNHTAKIPTGSEHNFVCSSIFPVFIRILESELLQVAAKITENKNDSLRYSFEAKASISYAGRGAPTKRVGEIQCLKNDNDVVIHTWKFQWTNPSPIGLQLNHKTAIVSCHSAFPDDVSFFYTPCETMTECQMKNKCLMDDSFPSCDRSTFPTIANLQKLGETTMTGALPQQSGMIRCHSPDVESTRAYYMTAGMKGIAEDTRNNNLDSSMIDIELSSTNLQLGDQITLECWIVERCFGEGPILSMKWRNDTITQVPQAQILSTVIEKRQGLIYSKSVVKILSTEVEDLGCLGLYPDSDGSYRSTINIVVQARNTVIMGAPEESIVITGGKPNNISCLAESYPIPSISWKMPTKATLSTKVEETMTNELTLKSTLVFSKFDGDLDGEYSCTACTDLNQNVAVKKFTVNFLESSSSAGAIVGVVIGLLVLFVLIGVAMFYGFRTWKRRVHATAAESSLGTPLTEKDIAEFKNGNPDAIVGSKDPYVILQNSPYDTNYDIQKEDLELDPGKMLGQGAYGMVMKGRIKSGKFQTVTEVAIKTVKPNAEPEYIKSLLTELKVMIYVGNNKNIVDLIGACTQNLHDKQLYVVLQLCRNGGLDNYLRNHRDVFVNQIERGRWDTSKVNQMYVNTTEGSLFTADLIRWSHQIASGMEYLAEKKVIHGDLATRNILLNETMVAKISDFGLARQMYEYTQYMKKQQAPLPWRWMAIESLRDMTFSTESDVWSFGITLWEILTLAETPYPGLTWHPQFITTLLDGYRMSKPKFAPSELYDIMLDCWREKPGDRTNFTSLKDQFQEILETNFSSEYINSTTMDSIE